MKKIILSLLIVVMVVVLGVGLTACNRATPQGQLSDLLFNHDHEKFEYSVKIYDVKKASYDQESGTYVAQLDKFKNDANVSFGSSTLTHVGEGIRVTGELVYGKTQYKMGCYYTLVSGMSYMVPAYSFLTVIEDGVTTYDMQGSYNGSTFECQRKFGDAEPTKNSVKLSGTIWDNNQIQQILRAIPSSTFSGGLDLSFTTPIANAHEFGSASLRATGKSTAHVKVPYTESIDELKENGINCYQITLSRTTQIKRTMTHTLYYAVDEVKLNGWGMKNVLVKMVEPFKDGNEQPFETHYELINIELA
ncbi:MAG: hypothetical protein K2N18_05050 [Clostridia bacterium]|nr:hypothetical protein [Clostridia bacterium]